MYVTCLSAYNKCNMYIWIVITKHKMYLKMGDRYCNDYMCVCYKIRPPKQSQMSEWIQYYSVIFYFFQYLHTGAGVLSFAEDVFRL